MNYYTHQLSTQETKTTIQTESLEDLAKIAEILARPILHTTEEKEHTFYIIENNTTYQYKTKNSQITYMTMPAALRNLEKNLKLRISP
jgi:hypothetical protein